MINTIKPFIYLPELVKETTDAIAEKYQLRRYDIDPDCFLNKIYPICQCNRRYVPVNGTDKSKCFFCNFTDRNQIKIYPGKIDDVAYCKRCRNKFFRIHKSKRVCDTCSVELRK